MMKFSTFSVYIAGLLRQPKWGHLKDLHKAIKLCEAALIATDPTITSLGTNLEVYSLLLNQGQKHIVSTPEVHGFFFLTDRYLLFDNTISFP